MRLGRIVLAGLLAAFAHEVALAQQGAAAPPPSAKKFSFELAINPLLECHFYLKIFGADSFKPDPASGIDLGSEINIYNTAQRTILDPEVWRWFEQLIVEGPDAAAVRKAAQSLPPALDNTRNQTGVRMIAESLESAYPKFETAIWPRHLQGVNRALVGAKQWLLPTRERLSAVLMEKMAFEPVDAPATIYVVLRSGGVTSWGKTSREYFTVVGASGLSSLVLVESALHEATHIVDTLQPFNAGWILKRVRAGLKGEAPAQVDIFIHGLIAYNAGVLVKRFVSPGYNPAGIRAPAQAEQYQPYVSTYQVIWNEYLDGKTSADEVVAKLLAEFRAVQKLLPRPVVKSEVRRQAWPDSVSSPAFPPG